MKKIRIIIIGIIICLIFNITSCVYADSLKTVFDNQNDLNNYIDSVQPINPDNPIDSFLFGNDDLYFYVYTDRNRQVSDNVISQMKYYYNDDWPNCLASVGGMYKLVQWVNKTDIETIKTFNKTISGPEPYSYVKLNYVEVANKTIKMFSRTVYNNLNGGSDGFVRFLRNVDVIYRLNANGDAKKIVTEFCKINNEAARKLTAVLENKKIEEIGNLIVADDIITENGDTLTEKAEKTDMTLGGIYELPSRNSISKTNTNIDNIVSTADSFIENSENSNVSTIKTKDIKDLSNIIYNILLIAGIIIAIIIGAVIGIKYIVGSIEEKANLKTVLIPYLVGCVIVFGAFGIWKLVVTIFINA